MVSISGITITNGKLTGNSGGGIDNQGTLTITGSTISGNSATDAGGGIRNIDGLTVIEHSTITDNIAFNGGGVASYANDATRTEVLSTIVSANTNTDVDFSGSTNSFISKGYNLVGDGNATSEFIEAGDQPNVDDPKLGAFADNGGPTGTHALLAGSPAIDKGKSALATDQRGEPRPFDDPNIAPATGGDNSDIGSFEAQSVLNTAPEATDDTYTVSEDGTLTIDAPGVLGNDTDLDSGDTLTVASPRPISGPANGTLTLNSDGSFTYAPNANYNGPDSFTYKANDGTEDSNTATVSITVNPVNDAPTIEVAAGGSCASASGTMNLTVGDLETAAGGLTLGKSSSNRTLVPNANIAFGGGGANRTVTITPAANKSGKATITLTVRDGNGGTARTTITVVVGTNNRETIFGTSASDMIFGKNGSDTINADNGNDLLCGGDGNDRLRGENGDDTLHGGQDEDTLEGGSGNDRLRGGEDEDTLSGNLGADFFSGGADTDTATDFNAAEGDTRDGT